MSASSSLFLIFRTSAFDNDNEIVVSILTPFLARVDFSCVDEYVRSLWRTLLDKALPVAKERRKSELVSQCAEETAGRLGVQIPTRKICSHDAEKEVANRRRRDGAEGRHGRT